MNFGFVLRILPVSVSLWYYILHVYKLVVFLSYNLTLLTLIHIQHKDQQNCCNETKKIETNKEQWGINTNPCCAAFVYGFDYFAVFHILFCCYWCCCYFLFTHFVNFKFFPVSVNCRYKPDIDEQQLTHSNIVVQNTIRMKTSMIKVQSWNEENTMIKKKEKEKSQRACRLCLLMNHSLKFEIS